MEITLRSFVVNGFADLLPGVKEVNCFAHDGQLRVNWLPPPNMEPSEYVIEWVSVPKKELDWQKVSGSANNVSLKGDYF